MISLKNIDINRLTPMMKQYYKIKKDAMDLILFYRLGDFYEMFFDDALIASKVLGLALTGRDCGLDDRAPMCGIPHHAATQYIKNLIDNGYKVGICEQLEDPATTKGIVDRGIIKIYTPGTILDDDYLNSSDNNFIASIFSGNSVGIAFCDVSTGELYIQENLNINDIFKIKSEVEKFSPSEIIINKKEIYDSFIGESKNIILDECNVIHSCNDLYNLTNGIVGIDNYDDYTQETINALYLIFSYLIKNKNDKLSHISKIIKLETNEYMGLDENAIKNLELSRTIYDGTKKGSLLSVLDKTVTSKGSRLLKTFIERPLVNVDQINFRLDIVEAFFNDPIKSENIRELLEYVSDIERINSKIVSMIAGPRDLIHLKNTLNVIPKIRKILHEFNSHSCNKIDLNFNNFVLDLIDKSIVNEPPNSINDGDCIKEGYNDILDEIKNRSMHSEELLLNYENKLKDETSIKNLRLKYNKVTGYFIEVSKGQIDNVPEHFKRIQTLKNVERYTTSDLAEIEYKILNSSKEALELEKQLYNEILENIIPYVNELNYLANNIASLDCFLSIAEVSRLNNYTRPVFNNEFITDIKECRHPVVELNTSLEMFIPNDAYFDHKNRYAIITGPNMSGKSTYMRTIALNQIMAQMGSFVPAKHANLSIIDNIFTRIGASDSLNSGKSTFMVEMSEVSNILNNATENSLLILDEVGRGTSTYDGMSIAIAVLEYIAKNIHAKTMFSTHYQEMSELENKLSGVFNLTLQIKENKNEILFLRKVIKGVTNKSYGIHVAKLAGLPETLTKVAEDYQEYFSSKNNSGKAVSQMDFLNSSNIDTNNLEVNNKYNELIKRLNSIDINNISPIEALNFLNNIKGEFNE